jgi:hypothetical protein
MNALRPLLSRSIAGPLAGAILVAGWSIAQAEIRVTGQPDAIRIEAQHALPSDVLGAVGAKYEIRNSAAAGLDQPITGVYAGSAADVIARVLAGYDYIVKHSDGGLTVTIYGKKSKSLPAINVTAAQNASAASEPASGQRVINLLATAATSQVVPGSNKPAPGGSPSSTPGASPDTDGSSYQSTGTLPAIPPASAVPSDSMGMAALTSTARAAVDSLSLSLSKLPPNGLDQQYDIMGTPGRSIRNGTR